MQADQFYGAYVRFDTASKRDAAVLLGADNLIGDVFDIVFETADGAPVAWIENRFGARVGFFDTEQSRQLQVLSVREWKLRAVLSLVAYTDNPAPGHYWGEVALLCYSRTIEHVFDTFVDSVGARLADGFRPKIDLGEQGVAHVLESDGAWMPKLTTPKPEESDGTVILKDRRKLTEGLIEQGRKGNKGCYIASWAFLLLVVAALAFGLKSCLGL